MQSFSFKAVNYDGEVREGAVQAATEAAAVLQIQESGFIPLSVTIAESQQASKKRKSLAAFTLVRGKKDKVIGFTRSLATLLNAGLPLETALKMHVQLEQDKPLQNMIQDAHDKLREGEDLATILSRYPQYFGNLYVGLVKAGEVTGKLDVNLDKLATYLEEAKRTRDALISALIYPVLLLLVTAISVLVLMVYVIPRFEKMFADMGGAIPDSTQFVFAVSELVREQGALFITLLFALFLLARIVLSNTRIKRIWDAWILGFPLVGQLLARFEVARFSHALGSMAANGIPLLNALSKAQAVISNSALFGDVEKVKTNLEQGGSMSEVFMNSKHFPQVAAHMIKVGEESGRLDDMMQRIAELCDSQVKVALQRLVSLVEPVLVIGLGVLVAGIIVSILTAVLSVNELVF